MDGLVKCRGLTHLTEISLTEKDKYCMISLRCGFQKKKDGKLVNKTERNNRERTINDRIGVCWTEKAMAPHSSTLAWKIPWTEEPGRLQSMESLRVEHN